MRLENSADEPHQTTISATFDSNIVWIVRFQSSEVIVIDVAGHILPFLWYHVSSVSKVIDVDLYKKFHHSLLKLNQPDLLCNSGCRVVPLAVVPI